MIWIPGYLSPFLLPFRDHEQQVQLFTKMKTVRAKSHGCIPVGQLVLLERRETVSWFHCTLQIVHVVNHLWELDMFHFSRPWLGSRRNAWETSLPFPLQHLCKAPPCVDGELNCIHDYNDTYHKHPTASMRERILPFIVPLNCWSCQWWKSYLDLSCLPCTGNVVANLLWHRCSLFCNYSPSIQHIIFFVFQLDQSCKMCEQKVEPFHCWFLGRKRSTEHMIYF